MNIFFHPLLIVLVVLSCCQAQPAKVVAEERDTTITPATSFSKPFLDSTKLEIFIKEQKAGDNAADQLRSFYRTRNYEFAWFTEDGVAEHTRSFWNLHKDYINYVRHTALKYTDLHRHIDNLMHEDTAIHITRQTSLQTELLNKALF